MKALQRAAGVDWWVARVVVSDRIPDTYVDIRDSWTMGDLAHAHRILDVFDAIAVSQRPKS